MSLNNVRINPLSRAWVSRGSRIYKLQSSWTRIVCKFVGSCAILEMAVHVSGTPVIYVFQHNVVPRRTRSRLLTLHLTLHFFPPSPNKLPAKCCVMSNVRTSMSKQTGNWCCLFTTFTLVNVLYWYVFAAFIHCTSYHISSYYESNILICQELCNVMLIHTLNVPTQYWLIPRCQ